MKQSLENIKGLIKDVFGDEAELEGGLLREEDLVNILKEKGIDINDIDSKIDFKKYSKIMKKIVDEENRGGLNKNE